MLLTERGPERQRARHEGSATSRQPCIDPRYDTLTAVATSPDTLEQSNLQENGEGLSGECVPGLLLSFLSGHATAVVMHLRGGELEVGRDDEVMGSEPDPRMSRRHALVSYAGGSFSVTDLGSRNGTLADGRPLHAGVRQPVTRVIRMGDTILLPIPDVRPLESHGVKVESGRVHGPGMQLLLRSVGRAAELGTTLFIAGESGTGKEGLAQYFHKAGPLRNGRFIAVNCATIPEGLAERLLFGAKRGAYSGADADTEGYIQAADGGTLFLDEMPDLAAPVQSKLLRVLETREVLQLGATRPKSVNFHICAASHKALRSEVAAGRLREDLYFRIARPHVSLQPLRQRYEEIPFLLEQGLRSTAPSLSLHASFVEACLLRLWPGNVRELLAELRSATYAALASGSTRLIANHLGSTAGQSFDPSSNPSDSPEQSLPKLRAPVERAHIEEALRAGQGNISEAARILGAHRTQVCRWIARYGIDAKQFAPAKGGRSSGLVEE